MRLPALILTVFFFATGIQTAYAQPTFSMPCPVQVQEGDQVCIPVRVVDFTDILGMEYTIQFQPGVLSFDNVTSFAPQLTGLDAADFDVSDAANGNITLSWDNGENCATSMDGVTTADNLVIYELCFTAVGAFGNFTEIDLNDAILPRKITRVNSNCNDIGSFIDAGCVSVGTDPLTLTAPAVNGNVGETVCVDLTVEDFDNMISLQFSLNWNPNVLEFQSASAADLSNIQSNLESPGNLSVNWFDPQTNCNSLPDGASILNVCFEIVGNPGNVSPLEFSSTPTLLETAKCVDDAILGVVRENGSVTVNFNDPDGLGITIDDATVDAGESFCLDVTVDNFDDINRMDFSITWNPNLLNLTSVTPTNALSGFNNGSLDQSQTNQGRLGVAWSAFTPLGSDLPDGTVLLTLCFTASGGGVTTVSVGDQPTPVQIGKLNDDDLGLNADNGLVDVTPPVGITVVAGNATVDPGETICIPVTVQNFDSITTAGFTLVWEPNVLQFDGVQNFGAPGLNAADFDLSGAAFGSLCLDYQTGVPATLFDDAVLFELCFVATGDPLECSDLSFQGLPCPIVATRGGSTQNIGATGVAGEVCLTNPFEFNIAVGSDAGDVNTQICLPVTVESFFNVTTLQFELSHDTDVLFFDDINPTGALPGFNSSSYDLTNAYTTGQITFDYQSPNGNGTSVPNGTVIFEICYLLSGEPGSCSVVDISENPATFSVQSNGTTLPATATDGEGCVNAGVTVTNVEVTPVTCPGQTDGAIDLTIGGGSGGYSFQWSNGATTEDLSGITNGCYVVTVTDDLNPNQTFEQEICVGAGAAAPTVQLPDDILLNCNELSQQICADPDQTSSGPDVTFTWTTDGGNVFDEDGACFTFFGSGAYFLTVERNGCSVTDTLVVTSAQAAGAVATATDAFDCATTEVPLEGSVSTDDDGTYQYTWTALDGGALQAGTANQQNAVATAPGRFVFAVYIPATDCLSTSDTLDLPANDALPLAAVVEDMLFLDCDTETQLLDGTPSASGSNIAYSWTDPDGNPISSSPTATATEVGVHTLEVINTTTSCSNFVTVEVLADTDFPTADAGPNMQLRCGDTQVTFDGSGSSTGAQFTYEWMNGSGIAMEDTATLNATAFGAGTFSLRVTDTSNGCTAISFVEVSYDTLAPTVNAGVDTFLTCTNPVLELCADTDADNALFQWNSVNDEGTIASPIAQCTEVSAAAVYVVQVANLDNNCQAADTVVVLDNAVLPEVLFEDIGTLTCNVDTISVDATSTTQGENFVYEWTGPVCIDTTDPLNVRISCPGTFTLTARDTLTGCETSASIMVLEDTTEPIANAGPDQELGCLGNTTVLDGSGSDSGGGFSFEWTPLGGATLEPGTETSLTPTAIGPGSFGLVVTNDLNGCTSSDLVFVTEAPGNPAVVNAGPDRTIDCTTEEVQLVGSVDPADENTMLWTTADGGLQPGTETQLTAVATTAGTYVLNATDDETGCLATDTVVVVFSTDLPFVDAGPDQPFDCGQQFVLLDGSNSDAGDELGQQWTTLDAGLILTDSTLDTIRAGAVGTYVLTVSDALTGCTASDTVEVFFQSSLPDATATADFMDCDPLVQLFGNQPNGTTGTWTVLGDADLMRADTNVTDAEMRTNGTVTFVWTLGAPGCENYSSDSVAVQLALPEVDAVDDNFTLVETDSDSLVVNFLQNDDFDPANGTLSLDIGGLPFGTITNFNDTLGTFTFRVAPLGQNRFLDLTYELCSDLCAGACDTATIRISVVGADFTDIEVPNAITPNGDGMNETLFFDLLETGEYDAPQMIIFNRWGSTVWQSDNYANDWDGTNQNGAPLPQGTYYYVLRLSIGEGEIIRGDVTVLR